MLATPCSYPGLTNSINSSSSPMIATPGHPQSSLHGLSVNWSKACQDNHSLNKGLSNQAFEAGKLINERKHDSSSPEQHFMTRPRMSGALDQVASAHGEKRRKLRHGSNHSSQSDERSSPSPADVYAHPGLAMSPRSAKAAMGPFLSNLNRQPTHAPAQHQFMYHQPPNSRQNAETSDNQHLHPSFAHSIQQFHPHDRLSSQQHIHQYPTIRAPSGYSGLSTNDAALYGQHRANSAEPPAPSPNLSARSLTPMPLHASNVGSRAPSPHPQMSHIMLPDHHISRSASPAPQLAHGQNWMSGQPRSDRDVEASDNDSQESEYAPQAKEDAFPLPPPPKILAPAPSLTAGSSVAKRKKAPSKKAAAAFDSDPSNEEWQAELSLADGLGSRDKSAKPPFSYAALIGQAILSTHRKRMSLNDIYLHIMRRYPYYRKEDAGWQNSIRHNLSLNECFGKTPRDQDNPGKGALWMIHEHCEDQFVDGGFIKRGGQAKTTKKKATGPVNSLTSALGLSDNESTGDISIKKSKKSKSKKASNDHSNDSAIAMENDDDSFGTNRSLRRKRKATSGLYNDSPSPPLQSALSHDGGIEQEMSSPNTMILPEAGPSKLNPNQQGIDHIEITAEMLSSPVRTVERRLEPAFDPRESERSQPIGLGFEQPAAKGKPTGNRNPFTFSFGGSIFESSTCRSPTSAARHEFGQMLPQSPLRRSQRAFSSPPGSAKAEKSPKERGTPEQPAEFDDDWPARPNSANADLQTPPRILQSPIRKPAQTPSSASRMLSYLQNDTPSRRAFTGFSTPGRTILSSPGSIYRSATYNHDPYDFGGLIESELDRFGGDFSKSPAKLFPSTPKFDTPRFHSSYSPNSW